MQRMLNKDYGLNVADLNFLSDFKIQQLSSFIEMTAELCQKCRVNKKTHYCMEPLCQQRKLLCWNCDPSDINGQHYLHEYAYCLPLFCKNVYENFTEIKENLKIFYQNLETEIKKVAEYLSKLQKIKQTALSKITSLEDEFQASLFTQFQSKVKDFKEFCNNKMEKSRIKFQYQSEYKIKDFFKNVKFYSAQECMKKQENIVKELLESVNNLKWLNNPQKQLKILLEVRADEVKKDIFLGSHKKIQFNEIDHFFKINNQFLTENMKTHKVQLKVESDFLNKTKFYQALVYHLRDVRKLSIENAHINQIRTPLTFKHLQQFEFNCNTETQPFNLRIQNIGEQLQSLVIRKLREQEIKILKTVVQGTKQLKKLHLEFYNKCDLSNSKEINQFWISLNQNQDNKIVDLCLKIRTQSQVKRMYGYLSKFYKDNSSVSSGDNNQASTCFITAGLKQLMIRNKQILHKISIEGVKNLVSVQILEILEEMPCLTSLKIKYDNSDLLSQLHEQRARKLQLKCLNKKRALYGLAYAEMTKQVSRKNLQGIFSDILFQSNRDQDKDQQ